MVCNQDTEDLKQRLTIILTMFSSLTCLSKPIEGRFLYRQTKIVEGILMSLQWRHNEPDGVSNHQPHDCLLNHFSRRRPKKTSKLRVTGLCAGNSPVTGEFPAQMASYEENVSIWWRHHVISPSRRHYFATLAGSTHSNSLFDTLRPPVQHIATPGSTHCDPRLDTMWPCG